MELAGANALERIRKAAPLPFYVVHGEYEFLNKEFAAALGRAFVPDDAERDSLTQRFDWSEGEKALDDWAQAAGTPSLFGGDQLLIVDNAHEPALRRKPNPAKNAKDGDKFSNFGPYQRFERVLAEPLDGMRTIFLCHEPLRKTTSLKGHRSDKFIQRTYPILAEKGAVIEFPHMYDNHIAQWLGARVRANELLINNETAEFMLAWAGQDLRHLANEVDKLAAYLGPGAVVTDNNIRELVTSCEDQFVYQLFDAIMEQRGGDALHLLEMSLKGSGSPLQIVASFGGLMRDMWHVRSLMDRGHLRGMPRMYNKMAVAEEAAAVPREVRESLSSLGVLLLDSSPFRLFQSVRRARLLPLKTIEAVTRRLSDIDCQLKGIRRPKKGEDEVLLQQLVSDLTFVVRREAGPTQRARR